MRDALRLVFGTLTVLPVRPPSAVDRRVAGRAMALAPVAGLVLGGLAAAVAWTVARVLPPLPTAVLAVAAAAVGTRLIHWDGLADTADGLGSGRPAQGALEVMRRGDIGPFGVFAVVTVFALQVAAVAALLAQPPRLVAVSVGAGGPVDAVDATRPVGAVGALVVAAVVGRLALALACRTGVPAARTDGLGAAVAGSVGAAGLAVAVGATALVVTAAALLDTQLSAPGVLAASGAAVAWALAATAYLHRRLGGMTGDTFGALVETTTAVALLVLAATA
jgi:adenosylcobinamide-GDP ribazoletransferase